MDSLEAEQVRGITMKSSAVSLVHQKGLFNLFIKSAPECLI
jgi:translation elongation factor EF-G